MLFLIEINEQVEAVVTLEKKIFLGQRQRRTNKSDWQRTIWACFNRKEEKEKGILINQIQRMAAEGMEKKRHRRTG